MKVSQRGRIMVGSSAYLKDNRLSLEKEVYRESVHIVWYCPVNLFAAL